MGKPTVDIFVAYVCITLYSTNRQGNATMVESFPDAYIRLLTITNTQKEAYIDDLVQDCSNSIANVPELQQFCSKPLTFVCALSSRWFLYIAQSRMVASSDAKRLLHVLHRRYFEMIIFPKASILINLQWGLSFVVVCSWFRQMAKLISNNTWHTALYPVIKDT